MAENRIDFYDKVIIDNNKEVDPLSVLTEFKTNDIIVWRVPSWAVNRPDLISYVHYNSVNLWWLLCMHNEIDNPHEDLYLGRELIIPDLNEYYNFYNKYSKVDQTPLSGYDTRNL